MERLRKPWDRVAPFRTTQLLGAAMVTMVVVYTGAFAQRRYASIQSVP
jgi:hypothetical protein